METKLSLLVDVLLTSENVLHRIEISKTIFLLLDSSLSDADKNELALRQLFKTHVKVCSVNPSIYQGFVITKIANFYERKYI